MLSDAQLTDFSYLISARFEAVNSLYLKRMGEHINKIGKLSASDVRRLEQMLLMQQNVEEINNQLMQATKLSLQELYDVYDISGMSTYGDSSKYYKANGVNQVPFAENMWIQHYLEGIKRQTAGTFANISRTTSIQETYRNLVDTAITAITTGMTDYKSAIRAQMSDAALQGIRVEYASGATRRLDSAIRMNVLEGCRQVSNMVRQQAGEEFGSDGVEISVHGLCAADHIDIQGRQFSNNDFAKVQASLRRKISTCNCQHYIFPIVLGVSEPVNSEQELAYYKQLSEEPVTLTTGYKKVGVDENGKDIYEPITKTCTRYEATQYQRNIETEVRKAKDLHIIAEASGDDVLKEQAKQRIKSLRTTYKRISEEANLTPKYDRMYVAGYNGKQVVPKSIRIQLTPPATQSAKIIKPPTKEDLRLQTLSKLSSTTDNDEKLKIIQNFGVAARTDVQSALDKKLENVNKLKQEKLYPAQSKFNNHYSDLYDKYSFDFPDKSLDDFDNEWNQIKKEVDWFISYDRDYNKYLQAGRKDAEYYQRRAQQHSNAVAQMLLDKGKYFEDWNQLVELYVEMHNIELDIKLAERLSITDGIEITKSVMQKYRTLGIEDVKRISKHLGNSKSPMRKVVEEAYQLYPREWIENSMQAGSLTPKKVDRGYYSHWRSEIAISGDGGPRSLETAIHELGHRFERTQSISQYETLLYNKRTVGEDLQWLGAGYGKDEKTRVDNWLHKYMGKDYGGSAWEIVSMGFEYAYTNPQLLLKDEEFANFIFGLLTLL